MLPYRSPTKSETLKILQLTKFPFALSHDEISIQSKFLYGLYLQSQSLTNLEKFISRYSSSSEIFERIESHIYHYSLVIIIK